MLKVLIVDDEALVRIGIKTSVDWNSMGFEIAGEAENGEKALSLVKEKHPDLILTDIVMPKMDGLTLIKAVKSQFPDIKIVVLSCHTDFKYVREAMQMWGALDYIPKLTIDPETLKELLIRVRNLLAEERSKTTDMKNTHIWSDRYFLDRKNSFFSAVLSNSITNNQLEIEKMELNIKIIEKGNYFVICADADTYENSFSDRETEKQVEIKSAGIPACIEKIINEQGLAGDAFQYKDRVFGINVWFGDIHESNITALDKLCREINRFLNKNIGVSFSFGISKRESSFINFRKAFDEALCALGYKIYCENGCITYFDGHKPINKIYYDIKAEQELETMIESCREQEAEEIILNVFRSIQKDKILEPSKIYKEGYEIVFTLSRLLKKYGGNIFDVEDDSKDPHKALALCKNIIEIEKWFVGYFEAYFLCLNNLKKKVFGKDIAKALEYIHGNYMNDINLKDVANYINMNSTYFSYLFKKETGENFIDYLNKKRIDAAKDYFISNDLNVYEVAEKIGFSNVGYFSKVFKKLTGISPNQYKNSKKSI